jgi:hypothetical protein
VAPGCGTAPNIVLSALAKQAVVAVTYTPSTGVGAASTGQTFTVSLDLLLAQR